MPVSNDWLVGGVRREAATRALHAAAREVLAERGIERFNVEAVAQRAGCSRATLYRLTGGKKALLGGVLGDAADAVASKVQAGVADLDGEERFVEAILIALAHIRADPSVCDWVRRAAVTDDYLLNSDTLASLAVALTGSDATAPYAGDWILRVVLSLVVWPVGDEEVERNLVRSYVAPAFLAPTRHHD